MNRKRRTEILVRSSMKAAEKLAAEIEKKYEVTVVEEPENVLVMVKMREAARKSLFYLGEVLATESKVQVNGKIGIGIATGNKPELSYWLSVIDAAYNAGLKETEEWDQMLLEEEKKINETLRKEQSKIKMTKVSFDNMDI